VKNFRHFTAHFGRYPLHPGNNQIHCFITARRKSVFHHDGGNLNTLGRVRTKCGLHIQRLAADTV
jgi:hypothetical protein